jgi:gamma-glutamyltranspeptidase/glutathione hydrolase
VSGPSAAVAAPRREAIAAGERLLAAGGNAIDAAVAAAFALCVVEPYMTGLGAVGELVYLDRSGRAHVVDAAARAPAHARDDMYDVVGEAVGLYGWPEVEGAANTFGAAAVTAPRLVAGLHEAHRRFGRLPWGETMRPAIELASTGWEIDYFTAAVLAHEMPTLARDPVAAELYYPDGFPLAPPIGNPPVPIRNERLAETLRLVAADGPAALGSGRIAREILALAGPPRGILTNADLADAAAGVVSGVEPLVRFRGWAIYGSPLPSGAATVAQILAILELAGPPEPSAYSPARYRRAALASHVAFSDRLSRLAGDDPPEDVALLLGESNLRRAVEALERGTVGGAVATPRADSPVTATTHVSAVDSDGAVVSVTHTLLSLFGAHVGVRQGGFFLNNGMLWFDPRPGRPNSIRPRARALAAMSPMIAVSPDGTRRLGVGALGARRIVPAVAQVIENVVDYGMTLDRAVDWPRVHADTNAATVDERLPAEVVSALAAAGLAPRHAHYGPTTLISARACGVSFDAATGAVERGIDARAEAAWRFGRTWYDGARS